MPTDKWPDCDALEKVRARNNCPNLKEDRPSWGDKTMTAVVQIESDPG